MTYRGCLAVPLWLLAAAALAQGAVDRPELHNGDTWSFTSQSRSGTSRFVREITGRDGDDYVVTFEKDGASNAVTARLSRDLNRIRIVDGKRSDSGWFQFPLTVGKSWAAKEAWADGKGYTDLTFTVVGIEQISVPAGKLEAVKIVGEGRWYNTTTNGSDSMEVVVWYAPAAHWIGKFYEKRWFRGNVGLEVTDELASFHLVN